MKEKQPPELLWAEEVLSKLESLETREEKLNYLANEYESLYEYAIQDAIENIDWSDLAREAYE